MKQIFPYERYLLQREPFFEGLSEGTWQILNDKKKVIEYKKGQIIFHENTYPTGVYFIESGIVKKYSLGQEGKEHIFYICSNQDLLGHHALLSQETFPDSAAAIEDSRIAFIPEQAFLEALQQSKTLSDRMLKNLGHEFGAFIHRTKILAQLTVRERVAIFLLILWEKYVLFLEAKDTPTSINLSRDDMANLAGTTKESLVRVLHDFKEEGIITSKGRSIKIIEPLALIKVSNYG